MSLINEALKRARDEAVRREASSKRIPLAPAVPTREHNRWFPITVLVLAVALVVSLVVVVNLSSKLTDNTTPSVVENPARSEAVVQTNVDPTPLEETKPPISQPTTATLEVAPSGEDTDSRIAVVSPRPELTTPPPETGISSQPQVDQSSVSQPTPDPELPEETTSSEPQSAGAEARVFVGQAQLAGGRSVDLGGIAWSESGPYALLNGRVVGIGDSVQGYRVSEIDPRQVTLERDTDRVILRLK